MKLTAIKYYRRVTRCKYTRGRAYSLRPKCAICSSKLLG